MIINDLIKLLKRVKNCDSALEKLKYMSQNTQWDKENRIKYQVNENNWFEYMKTNLDECIRLIENDDKEI